jgi:hypothetical protein
MQQVNGAELRLGDAVGPAEIEDGNLLAGGVASAFRERVLKYGVDFLLRELSFHGVLKFTCNRQARLGRRSTLSHRAEWRARCCKQPRYAGDNPASARQS